MPRAIPVAVAALFLSGTLLPRRAAAQGESAAPQPARTLRLTIGADWAHWTDVFGTATPLQPSLPDGARLPLGAYFSSESLGVRQLPFLAPVQDTIRSLTGLPGWALNAGRARVTLDASVRSMPIRAELALSERLGVVVNVPLVRARMSAFLTGPDSATASTHGNVGFNRAFVTPGALDAFRLQADTALRALRYQMTSGPAALRAQAQALYASLQPLACGLYDLGAGSAASASSPCYSAAPIPASPLLPLDTSAAGQALTARLGQGQTSYATLAAQYAAAGVAMPAFTSGYALPGAPLDSAGVRQLFYDPRILGGDSLNDVVRTRLGDIELGAWFQLADRPRWRSQVQLTLRLPTGSPDSPDNFIDLPTGTHQRGLEVALRNDFLPGGDLWFHVGGRYGFQSPDQLERRVSPWYLPFVPAADTALVQRNPGNYWALDLVPNWQLDPAFGVAIGWHYYHQGATTVRYVDPADFARLGVDAGVLGQGTAVDRLRVGAGATFSTLERYAAGRARLPYRITFSYNATLYGRGGQVPRDGVMTLMVQAYLGKMR